MKDNKHRRDTSFSHIEICTDFSADFREQVGHSKQTSLSSVAPIRGILKKSPKANCSDSNPQPSPEGDSEPHSSRLLISNAKDGSKVCASGLITEIPEFEDNHLSTSHSTPRCSPKTRYSPMAMEDMLVEEDCGGNSQIEISLKTEMRKVIETIKGEMQESARNKEKARMVILAETMEAIESMKKPGKDRDQSLVVMDTTHESGSEAEHPSASSNHSSIKFALEAFATSPQELSDLLSLLESTSTPRVTLLLRKNRLEGMYRQCHGGWRKIYGGKNAPAIVEMRMVKMGFEVRGRDLMQVGEKQIWKADAFTL